MSNFRTFGKSDCATARMFAGGVGPFSDSCVFTMSCMNCGTPTGQADSAITAHIAIAIASRFILPEATMAIIAIAVVD